MLVFGAKYTKIIDGILLNFLTIIIHNPYSEHYRKSRSSVNARKTIMGALGSLS